MPPFSTFVLGAGGSSEHHTALFQDICTRSWESTGFFCMLSSLSSPNRSLLKITTALLSGLNCSFFSSPISVVIASGTLISSHECPMYTKSPANRSPGILCFVVPVSVFDVKTSSSLCLWGSDQDSFVLQVTFFRHLYDLIPQLLMRRSASCFS